MVAPRLCGTICDSESGPGRSGFDPAFGKQRSRDQPIDAPAVLTVATKKLSNGANRPKEDDAATSLLSAQFWSS